MQTTGRSCLTSKRFSDILGPPTLAARQTMSEFPDNARSTALRRAIRWLSDQGVYDVSSIEQACRRFDLCPADEEFLLRQYKSPPGKQED